MAIEKVRLAAYPATDRVWFVVYRIDPLPNEYHIYKEVRDAFGGGQWFGAIHQCEKSEAAAMAAAKSAAANYSPPSMNGG